MKRKLAIFALLLTVVPSHPLLAATRSTGGNNRCQQWAGSYLGTLTDEQTVLGQTEKVTLLVQSKSVYLALQGDVLPGAFEASSERLKCSRERFESVLDSGFGGLGKITLRKSGQRTYLKIYGFSEGSGPTKQGFLPSKPTELEVNKAR